VSATDKRARRPVGFGGHAAGIHNDHIGFRGWPDRMPGGKQPVADCFAIGTGGTASKVLDVKGRSHTSV
jgi:hypothetical protein